VGTPPPFRSLPSLTPPAAGRPLHLWGHKHLGDARITSGQAAADVRQMPHTTSRHPDSSVRMDGTGESENVSDITVDAPRVRRSYNRLVNNPVLEDYSLRYAPKSSVPGRPMRWHRPRSAASPISPIRPSAARSPCSSALRTRGVPGEADQQHAQLNGVLSGLGMTADTEVTILSDGADGPRSLGEAASTGTVFHVLDRFCA
jgi:hypothetical protein